MKKLKIVKSSLHSFISILQKTEGPFTRQSKNGMGPTKTGTVPTVFTKKQ